MDPHFSYKICDGENFWVGRGAQGVEPGKGEKVVLLQLLIIADGFSCSDKGDFTPALRGEGHSTTVWTNAFRMS